jgi:hypothetical protein
LYVAPGGDVGFDGDRECGEVFVADDLADWRSASSMPAAVQRRHMSPFCQRLTLRLVARQIAIIDSIGFVEDNVFQSCSWTPRRYNVTVSARPSRSDAAAPGCECASSPASASKGSSAARWSVSFQAARSLRLTAGRSRSGR